MIKGTNIKAIWLLIIVTIFITGTATGQCTWSVEIGQDTIVGCQQVPVLEAGSNNPDLVYTWWPNDLVNDSTSRIVEMVEPVHNVTMIVEAHDTTNGCAYFDSVVVSYYTFMVDTFYWCPGDYFVLDAGPGADIYDWLIFGDTTQTVTVDTTGFYGVVSTFPGCSPLTSGFWVLEDGSCPPVCNLPFDIGPDTIISCGPIPIQAPPGLVYDWNPGTILDDSTTNNVQVVEAVYDQLIYVNAIDTTTGCRYFDRVRITNYVDDTILLDICPGDSIQLEALPGALAYLWQHNNSTQREVYVYDTGTYIVEADYQCGNTYITFMITPAFGCATNCALPIDIGVDTVAFCNPRSAGWLGVGSYNPDFVYNWSPVHLVSTPNRWATGFTGPLHLETIAVEITDTVHNCVYHDSAAVSNYIEMDDTLYWCAGNVLTLDAGAGGNYHWSNGSTDQTLTVTAPGVYEVVSNFSNCGPLESRFAVLPDPNCSGNCNWSVEIGADTIVGCQQAPILEAGWANPNLSYTWWPNDLVDDSTSRVVEIVEPVHNVTLIVEAHDVLNGCSYFDSVVVSYYTPVFDSLYWCPGDTFTLSAQEGATFYDWSTPLSQNTQSIEVDTAGFYFVVGLYPQCGALTSSFTVLDSCLPLDSVWPGDANLDGIADLYDVLNIGLVYNQNGLLRPNANTTWTAQAAPDWAGTFSNGLNHKHADCDGNAVVDTFDVMVVDQNYGLTHNKGGDEKKSPTDPDLYLEFQLDSVQAGNIATVNVYLGRDTLPVTNGYGVAFTLNYDPLYVDSTTIEVDFSNSWLTDGASDKINFRKPLHSNGQLDITHTRGDQVNASGHGLLGAVSYYIQDNIIGKDIVAENFPMSISGARLISNDGVEIEVNQLGDETVVFDDVSGLQGYEEEFAMPIQIYPNPSKGSFIVELILDKPESVQLSLFNTLGQGVHVQQIDLERGKQQVPVKTNQLVSGIYFLQVSSTNGSQTVQLIIE